MTPHFPHYRTKSALTAALVRKHLKPHRRTPLYGVRGVRCGAEYHFGLNLRTPHYSALTHQGADK